MAYIATRKRLLDILKILLGRGACPNLGTSGWTPLIEAVGSENKEAVDILLRSGALANRRVSSGSKLSPLDAAMDVIRI
jgi:ankyrin repeat protein